MGNVLNQFVSTAKVIDNPDFIVKAELNAKQKEKVDGWVKKYAYSGMDTSWQNDAFGGKSHGRHIIKIDGQAKPIPVPDEVSRALKSANVTITDYAKGIGTDSYGRQTKIGKILKRTDPAAAKVFDEDKNRQGVKAAKYQVVISRLPYDVAGMSTGRGWTSCQDLENSSGLNKALMHDIKQGTVVAYLTKEGDDEIKNPTARISLKPYYASGGDGLLRAESTMYGTASSDLSDKFRKAIEGWQDTHFKADPSKTYKLAKGVYNDSLPPKILSDRARSKFYKELKDFNGSVLNYDMDARRELAESLPGASVKDLLLLGNVPNLRNTLSRVTVKPIANLSKAVDEHPDDMLGFYPLLNDKQKIEVTKNLPPLALYNLAVSGDGSVSDVKLCTQALKGMSREAIDSLGPDYNNSIWEIVNAAAELPDSKADLKHEMAKQVLLKSPTKTLGDLFLNLVNLLPEDFLKNKSLKSAFNKAPAYNRLGLLSKLESEGLPTPKDVVDRALKDLPKSLKAFSGNSYTIASRNSLRQLKGLDKSFDIKPVVSAIIKNGIAGARAEDRYLDRSLVSDAAPYLDRDLLIKAFSHIDPDKWHNGFNKDAIIKHGLKEHEVEHIEKSHRSEDDNLKRWIHRQTNPATIENRFFMPFSPRASDAIKKVARNRINYLDRKKHKTTAKVVNKVEEVLKAFQVTANTAPHPVKVAEQQANALSKQEKTLESKIQKDAQKHAAKGGHVPSADPDTHKKYQEAVDHHIAHHPDIHKLTAIKKDAAKARVALKRLKRQSKTTASADGSPSIPNKTETKAFHKRAFEAEKHWGNKVKELSEKRAKNSAEADHHFDKANEYAIKKSEAHAKSLGHKPGTVAFKKAASSVHMDHFLNHPSSEKNAELLKKGNKLLTEHKKASNEHKLAKLNLKNAEKYMKHHKIPLPKKK